jgi:protein TonB
MIKRTFLFISLVLFSAFGFGQDTLQEPRMFVQEMPAYPAGDEVMIREILKYVVYPEQEKLMKIEGTVKVRFVVEKDGTPSNFEVIQGVVGAPRLDDAALFACKQLGKFNPGKQDDMPQRVYRIIPIKFSLP